MEDERVGYDPMLKTGGYITQFDKNVLRRCASNLPVYRKFKKDLFKFYGAGSPDWAQHTAQTLRKNGKSVRVVPFGDSRVLMRAIYVRLYNRIRSKPYDLDEHR